MTSPSFSDLKRLSAFLDGQVSARERIRLEKRIKADVGLAAALEELRQTRNLLKRTPKRRAPRNFTLTAKMAGIRPPVPRVVPVLSWASAVAMLSFVLILGSTLIGKLSFGPAAPMLAAAPSSVESGAVPATAAPALAVPPTAPPSLLRSDQQATPTPALQAFSMPVPEATQPAASNANQPPASLKAQGKPINPWFFILPGLAVFLLVLALLVRFLNRLAFQRKNQHK